MARILFCWELGAGYGHILPYVRLLQTLEQAGHDVVFATRAPDKTAIIKKHLDVKIIQSPLLNVPREQLLPVVDSFPKILHNNGYATQEQIESLLQQWEAIFQQTTPDLCIFEFAPTALLAARKYNFQKMIIGNAFFVPPNVIPFPGLKKLQGGHQDSSELIEFERDMLLRINAALKTVAAPILKRLYELHDIENILFTSFKELDVYPERNNGEFVGPLLSLSGKQPDWPAGSGSTIFIYLHSFPEIKALLNELKKTPYRILAYITGLSDTARSKYSSANIKFVDEALDIQSVSKTAELCICNGNFGTAQEMLLNGVPILSLPIQAEQNLLSRRIAACGAGIVCAGKAIDKTMTAIDHLLTEPSFRQQAFKFSAGGNKNQALDTILSRINALL